jgi:hypothetical protein
MTSGRIRSLLPANPPSTQATHLRSGDALSGLELERARRDARALRRQRASIGLAILLVAVSGALTSLVEQRDPANAQTTRTEAPEPDLGGANDVIDAINAKRLADGVITEVTLDPVLSIGAQEWADSIGEIASVKHDPSMRSAVDDGWDRLAEYVVSAPTLRAAYERLAARPDAGLLFEDSASFVGLGVVRSPNQAILVARVTAV